MRVLMATLFVVVSLSPAIAQVEFNLVQTLDLSSPPPLTLLGEHLQLVDVTDDGFRDLLLVEADNLTTYEYQSSGEFTEIDSAPLPITGTLAAVADFNDDGQTDALVRLLNGYSCFLGDGTGAFTQAGLYQTTSDIGHAVVGDFDGDSVLDVAVARGFGTPFLGYYAEVIIRLGDGTGYFGAPNLSEFDTDGLLNYTVVMDLDENGTDDLILSALEQLNFVFITNGAIEDIDPYPVAIDDTPRDFQIQDLNDDGHEDIVFTCAGNGVVGVFLQDGTGTIGPFEDYPANGTTFTVRVEDVNGDTIPDLLTTSDSGLEWRLGAGDGSFGDPNDMSILTPEARFAAGDSTSDGLAEVAILSGNTVSVLLNTTQAGPQPGEFIRGDVDLDGEVSFADAIHTFQTLFVPGSPPIECPDSADSNDDGSVNLVDGVYLLFYLYVPASPPPPAPGVNDCGIDPTPDSLADCGVIDSCL